MQETPRTPTPHAPAPVTGSPNVATTQTITTSAASPEQVRKVIVAVHGIGDQLSFATIQSVVNRFCSYYCEPAGIPLGSFHTGEPGFSFPDPYPKDRLSHLAFAEVYWAAIPRAVVNDRYTLEETKEWARTIVERFRLRWVRAGRPAGVRERDFALTSQVLTEMIQTIAVVDRICHLGEKAGLFTFDLRKLLDAYLGDVQIVAEFRTHRTKILKEFFDLMQKVGDRYPGASIHLVAHSEGTVVALLGLLRAFRPSGDGADGLPTTRPAWTAQVKGLMTIGSPIDKHLTLWPDLFGGGPPQLPLPTGFAPITWHNYYDYGDPVGFELDDARRWLATNGWRTADDAGGVFAFPARNDHGFGRYPFPGKAHVDYWKDDAVFGHFIQNVVGEPVPQRDGRAVDYAAPPRGGGAPQWLSYVVPYLGFVALLCVAAYVIYKAIVGAILPDDVELQRAGRIARDVGRIGLLLAGVTVAARIPRLTRSIGWNVAALAIGLLGAAAYVFGRAGGFATMPGVERATVVLALLLLAVGFVAGTLRPTSGLRPLLWLGALMSGGLVVYYLASADGRGPLWPVFLATAGFLYLWWLAALLFDLVFVWHLYIRNSGVVDRMRAMAEWSGGGRDAAPPPPVPGGDLPPARKAVGVT